MSNKEVPIQYDPEIVHKTVQTGGCLMTLVLILTLIGLVLFL